MWRFEKEKGFFILTNKLTGEVKIIDVPFDWDRADALLKKGERIYAALNDQTGRTIPAACEDISVCEGCKLRHICTAAHGPSEASMDDGELETLILRKEELAPSYRAYNEVSDQIKQCVGDRDKVITGNFLVKVSTINKKSYTVPARTERRINISRL